MSESRLDYFLSLLGRVQSWTADLDRELSDARAKLETETRSHQGSAAQPPIAEWVDEPAQRRKVTMWVRAWDKKPEWIVSLDSTKLVPITVEVDDD